MIYTHSVGGALQYFPDHTATLRDGKPMTFVELDLSAEQLKQYCKTRTTSYKVPRHIEFMTDELPKSGSGKILKRVLREKYWVGQTRRV